MGNGNLTSRNLFSHREVKQPSFEGISAITKKLIFDCTCILRRSDLRKAEEAFYAKVAEN